MVWSNQDLTLYHGTSTTSLLMAHHQLASLNYSLIQGFNVQVSRCNQFNDFGRGFYMTSSMDQAKWWANLRAEKDCMASGRGTHISAVLLSFSIDRDWLAGLDTLTFVLPTTDFHDFVDSCRNGRTSHLRSGNKRAYDIVHGPVRAGGPKRMIYQNCDQISFHNQQVCNNLAARVNDLAPHPSNPQNPGVFQTPPP